MAYHDIATKTTTSVPNLYKAWLMTQNAAGIEDSAVWKSKFVDFIEEHCKQRLHTLKVKQNRHFDPV